MAHIDLPRAIASADQHAVRTALEGLPPSRAARAFPWLTWRRAPREQRTAALAALATQDRDWIAEFVTDAAGLRFEEFDLDVHAGPALAEVLRPLLLRCSLPVPSGVSYLTGWARWIAALQYGAERSARGRPDPSASTVTRVSLDDGVVWTDQAIETTTLATVLRDEPLLAETLDAVLATPGLVGRVLPPRRPPFPDVWTVPQALQELADGGALDRSHLITTHLQALTVPDAVTTQRVLAENLTALGLSAADVPDGLPAMQNLLATAHGSVTKLVLPVALELVAVAAAADMAELASTVFGRSEKAQRSTLLKALTTTGAVSRFGPETVSAGLEAAAASDDLQLAARAAAALAELRPAEEQVVAAPPVDSASGLWAARPTGRDVHRLDPPEPSPAAAARLVSANAVAPTLTSAAELLAVEVAIAFRDPGAERRAPRPSGFASPWAVLLRQHEEETHAALGTVEQLLSTPSLSDGTLLFDDLLARIRATRASGYRPLDLLLALLRLEPVDSARAGALRGLSLGEQGGRRRGLAGLFRSSERDGVRIVQQWLEGGGAQYPAAQLDGAPRVGAAALPSGQALVPSDVTGLLTGAVHPDREPISLISAAPELLSVVPRWSEPIAVLLEPWVHGSAIGAEWIPSVAELPRLGPAAHRLLIRALSHPNAPTRLIGAEALLTAIARGTFDAVAFTDDCLRLLSAGELPLARTAGALDQVVQSGGMAAVWPAVLALTEAACGGPSLLPGTAELLGVVRRRLIEVPDRRVPEAVLLLGERSGSGRAVAEARAIVEAFR